MKMRCKRMKKQTYIALTAIVMVVLLSGCATQTLPVAPAEKGNTAAAAAPTAIGVTRVLSAATVNPGDTVTVKLYVNLKPEQTYYLADEKVPKGFKIVGADFDKNNEIKYIEIQNAKTTVLEYNLIVPNTPGTYGLDGDYAIESMASTAKIMGDNKVIVN
jgi:hypothetical protein